MKAVVAAPATKSGRPKMSTRKSLLVVTPNTTLLSIAEMRRRRAMSRGFAVGDNLCQHRVVERRNRLAARNAGVDAHALAARRPPHFDAADRWQEAGGRVLRIEPRFDRVTAESSHLPGGRAGARPRRCGFAARTRSSPVVEFGDGMLDLQPGVHLEEIELALGVEQKFNRPRAAIFYRARRFDSGPAHFFAQVRPS